MTQSKAMELDLENEIEKTKKEGILTFELLYCASNQCSDKVINSR